MRVVGVGSSNPRLLSGYVARRLNAALGIETLASELPLGQLVARVQQADPQICHLHFEYRTFGGSFRTLIVLPLFVRRVARRAKLVVTVHGLVTREAVPGLSGRISVLVHRTLIRLVARSSQKLVVLSERMRSELASAYGVENVAVIPHGSDPVPTGPPPRAGPYLLFFGFTRPSKGIEELIDAFGLLGAEFPDLQLLIAGGPAKSYEESFVLSLKQQIARHPFRDRIRFDNRFIDWAEKDELARSARIIVLPYKDRFVEVSGVVHTVAGSGVPIVCSTTPRFDELVEGAEALHADPTPESIADAVRRILRDPSLATRLSEGIRAFSQRTSWELVGHEYWELYRSLVGGAGASKADVREASNPKPNA